ncbi:T7SS effector LXG polymorphic toxin [Metabacillus bambusae]|uniref:LXG domain-containing protein n=1 Tax=Metabacillus bambusae TaxID=2795218 RepID=A0ABS3NAG7_9BACI|nr:T7SS effector LXG polymorphic toxin [Metabacillus bambusae]MBO1515281.1 hypothetical protein [Metabacillus bambusae]
MKVLDTNTLVHTMEARSQAYKKLREQLEQVKRKCNDIVNLDDQFKRFYQAQITQHNGGRTTGMWAEAPR